LSARNRVIICSKFVASLPFDDWPAGCTRAASQASVLVPGLFVVEAPQMWIFALSGANLQAPDQQPNQFVDLAQCSLGIEVLNIIHVPVFDTVGYAGKAMLDHGAMLGVLQRDHKLRLSKVIDRTEHWISRSTTRRDASRLQGV
jgi:hypothetical protein